MIGKHHEDILDHLEGLYDKIQLEYPYRHELVVRLADIDGQDGIAMVERTEEGEADEPLFLSYDPETVHFARFFAAIYHRFPALVAEITQLRKKTRDFLPGLRTLDE